MRSSLLAWILTCVQASEAERNLHEDLFDPTKYNPRVIQDSWRKANRLDYDNIGAFATDKCAGYKQPGDTSAIMPGSLLVTESFATMRPYENNMDFGTSFHCPNGATIRLRLDIDRGFNVELGYDYLEIDYSGYYRKLSGNIDSLPNELKQKDWFDTESDYIRMQFVSDYSDVRSGFKFDIMCAEVANNAGGDGRQATDTKTVITNDDGNSGLTGTFSKEVTCQLSSERIKYRLMRERINPADAEIFEMSVEETVTLTYGISSTEQSLNATNSDWVETNAREIFVFFNAETFDMDDNGSGYDSSGDYGSGSGDNGTITTSDSRLLVTFFIEVKCEQMLEVSEAIDQQALIETDDTLLTEMKQLNTVDDVTKFWKDANDTLVEQQVGLIREFALETNCTDTSCLKGFIVKRNNSVTSFSPFLPEEMCEQYVYTQLTLALKSSSRRDYTEIFEENEQFKMLQGLVNPAKERSGYVYDPIEIDVYLQIKAINDINLNEEYMDASIVITMIWYDRQLSWKTGSQQATARSTASVTPMNNSTNTNTTTEEPQNYQEPQKDESGKTSININSIRADRSQVWIPEIEIINRANDFSPVDEKKRQLKIESSGKVIYSRAYRMRSMMSSSLNTYPYDVQFANIILSSADYSSEKVKLTVQHWVNDTDYELTKNGWYDESVTKKSLDAVKYKYYNGNTEWNFFAYKIEAGTLTDNVLKKEYSAIDVKFGFQRNSPYYTMTLIIPITTLTVLAPLGLIIPVEAGEKLGFQVTLLLTVVIYIDYLQNNIPVFDTLGQTPNLLVYFVTMILLMTLSLLVTTYTLFLYHVNSYESANFSKSEAKISMYMAKFFTHITFKIWEVDVPPKVMEIIEHDGDEIHKTFDHDDLSLGFKFMADMMNRMFFLIIVIAEIVAFAATILTAIPAGDTGTIRLNVLNGLEEVLVNPLP